MKYSLSNKFWQLLLVLAVIILPITVSGKVVTQSKALEIANKFYYGQISTKGIANELKLKWSSNEIIPNTKSTDNAPAYYLFVPASNKGFILISGDDVIKPILGYSFDFEISDSNNMPPALEGWLIEIAQYIQESRKKGSAPAESVKTEWEAIELGNIQNKWVKTRSGSDAKLLETALWNQSAPFNKFCPMDGEKRSITGCVATAVGIVMYYHKWPDAGIGKTVEYTTKTNKLKVTSRDLEIPYDWENMLPSYKNTSYTTAQSDAVARLLADIGALYQADYKSSSTGAVNGSNYMYKNFKYDSGTSPIARKDYFEEQFDNILKREIDNKRPVLYSGTSDDGGGHAFVIDGYDNAGNFHINWGWGGNSNGYFALTNHDYDNKQQAYINIKPDTKQRNLPEYWLTLYNNGLESSISNYYDYKPNEYFTIRALVNNRTAIDFNGYVRLGIVNKQNQLKEWITDERSFELHGKLTPDGKSYKGLTLNAKYTKELEIGDRIRFFYRIDGIGWMLAMADPVDWDDVKWELPVADQQYIREGTSAKYDHTKKTLTFRYSKGIVATLLHNDTVINEGVEITEEYIKIDVTKLEGTSYTVRLVRNKELEEIEFSIESK